jgi:hypothetical protein
MSAMSDHAAMKAHIESLAGAIEARGKTREEMILFRGNEFERAGSGAVVEDFAEVLSLDVPMEGELRVADYPHYNIIRPIRISMESIPDLGGRVIMAQLVDGSGGATEVVCSMVAPPQGPEVVELAAVDLTAGDEPDAEADSDTADNEFA